MASPRHSTTTTVFSLGKGCLPQGQQAYKVRLLFIIFNYILTTEVEPISFQVDGGAIHLLSRRSDFDQQRHPLTCDSPTAILPLVI